MHKPKYIEFVGLPGAGKTTLLEYMSKQDWFSKEGFYTHKSYMTRNSIFTGYRDNKIYKLLLCLINIKTILLLFKFYKKSGALKLDSLRRSIQFVLLTYSMNSRDDFIFQDQGLIQSLASLLVPNSKNNWNIILPPLLKKIITDKVYLIVHVKIDTITSLDRINNRELSKKGSRADCLQNEEQELFLFNYKKALNIILQQFRKNSQCYYLELNGTDSIEKKESAIKLKIESILLKY